MMLWDSLTSLKLDAFCVVFLSVFVYLYLLSERVEFVGLFLPEVRNGEILLVEKNSFQNICKISDK